MTRDEWDQIEEALRSQYRPVCLDVDDYLVRLMLERVGEMKLGITVYVDGWFRGSWLLPDRETGEWPEVARRFLQLREKSLHSPKDVRKFERSFGKRRTKEMGLYKKHYYRLNYWGSAKSLRRHFNRENSSIRWLPEDEYQARIGAASGLETQTGRKGKRT